MFSASKLSIISEGYPVSMLPEDFPHIWQKPTFEELLDCLEKLHVKPRVWGSNVSHANIIEAQNAGVKDRREISQFLSSIISSNLNWINNEDKREELWTVASKRLAERCGRTAMGEITRSFSFIRDGGSKFDLTLREPPITGEALGLKTWGSSYVLAKLLPQFAKRSIWPWFDAQRNSATNVLELGSGTGLLGLAAACFWRTPVTLTDLPTIVPNLGYNVDANRAKVEGFGGHVNVAPLTWGNREETDTRFQVPHQYQVVIAADPIYDDNHPSLLATVIDEQLSLRNSARALVMVPLRDEITWRLVSMFQEELHRKGKPLVAINQDIVKGQDDWGEDNDGQEVDCWWAIFGRVELDMDERGFKN